MSLKEFYCYKEKRADNRLISSLLVKITLKFVFPLILTLQMKSASYEKKKFYRIPPSKYWPQYWSTCFISTIATFQLLVTLAILGMEIGNALIDLYKANLYTGFWSFPFTFIATIAAYVSGKV